MYIREVRATDDLVDLTNLIRSAYKIHSASGLRYWATHQSVEDTAKRFAGGVGFVAEVDNEIVATITLRRPELDSKVPLLREPETWSFGQFCVSPSHQGNGFGKKIHDFSLMYAYDHGCRKIALYTAQPAVGLIAMYQTWGYALVGTCDWRPHTNYLSVLMSQLVTPPPPT
jgi:GNAT superfamily N-acetyltransferase